LVELANASEKYMIKMIYETFDSNHFETFEKIMEKDNIDTLVENILNFEHIIEDNQDSIIVVLGEGFQPLGLCCDIK
jgi:flagellin-specific chaperone FliS